MNETFFQLWLGFMFLLGGACGGAWIGVLVATKIARRHVEGRMPKLGEFFVAESINLYSFTTDEDGQIVRQRMTMTTTAQEFNARMAEHWLEQRNLVAMPKGRDFKVKAPAGGPDASR